MGKKNDNLCRGSRLAFGVKFRLFGALKVAETIVNNTNSTIIMTLAKVTASTTRDIHKVHGVRVPAIENILAMQIFSFEAKSRFISSIRLRTTVTYR